MYSDERLNLADSLEDWVAEYGPQLLEDGDITAEMLDGFQLVIERCRGGM